MPRTPKSSPRKVDQSAQLASTGAGHMRLVEAKKYSLKEAAKLAGVCETTMRNEVRNGEIPVIQIGTKSVIVQWDLEQYLQHHYTVVGSSTQVSIGSSDLPDWVENSPLLQPKRNAS